MPQAFLILRKLLQSTYMDDTVGSVKDVAAVNRLYEELTKLWPDTGMPARK